MKFHFLIYKQYKYYVKYKIFKKYTSDLFTLFDFSSFLSTIKVVTYAGGLVRIFFTQAIVPHVKIALISCEFHMKLHFKFM